MAYDYDLFTIGAGSGGVAASRRAAALGIKTGIAEYSRIGGTCVIRGCVPKKLFMYAAQFADAFTDAAGYGWTVPHTHFEWSTLIAEKDRETDRLNGIYINMLNKSGVDIHEGRARLLDPHTVAIGEHAVTAERILIAAGGRPVRPDIPGGEHAITSNEAFHLTALPRRMVIIGAGYIACEFASIFNNLGVEVTMLVRGEELLRGFDDDVRVAVSRGMRDRGIEVHTRCAIDRIEKDRTGYSVFSKIGQEFDTDLVFAATGRTPNTDGMCLDDAGVELTRKGAVVVDTYSKTSVDHIYAIGDVTDRVALTPVAIAEGRAFVETIYKDNPTEVNHALYSSAVFSMPPIGTVGMTEQQARDTYGDVEIYRTSFRPMKNVLAGRDEKVLMKLIVDRASDKVVGCHLVGLDTPEMAQTLGIALEAGATKAQFDRTMALHPTTAEELVLMYDPVVEEAAKAAE